MAFDCITEGSKDYIKYVLQLTEESMTGITYVAPGRKKETKKDPSFTFSGGAGGKGLGGKPRGDTIKPGYFINKKKEEDGDKLRGKIMFGTSAVPGVVAGKSKKGKIDYSTQGGLDYLTSLSQAQSAIEFANQMMPAALKLALSASCLQVYLVHRLEKKEVQYWLLAKPTQKKHPQKVKLVQLVQIKRKKKKKIEKTRHKVH